MKRNNRITYENCIYILLCTVNIIYSIYVIINSLQGIRIFSYKITSCILLIILLFTLTGCGKHIEDTNGAEDFTLETITEEDILNGYPVSSVKQSMERDGNEEIFKGSFQDEDIAITLNTSVESGNAQIVLVYKNIILKRFLLNEDNQVFSMTGVKGEIRILVAGESAKVKIDCTVESSKGIS